MRRTATAAVILSASLLFTACSSEDDTAADPSSGTESSSAPAEGATEDPTEDADEEATEEAEGGSDDVAADAIPGLALTAEDFPAPYTFQELPPGALEQGAEAVGGALAGAEFTPPECGDASQATQADLTQSGLAIAADESTGTSVSSVLSPQVEQTVDIEEIAETCSTFSFTLQGPDGAPLEGDATLELLPEPEVDADDARAVKTSVTVTVSGQEQVVDTVIYSAELRGVSVVSSASSLGGSPVDNAVLEGLLVTGLDKVRSAP